jgi:hypothetical protein
MAQDQKSDKKQDHKQDQKKAAPGKSGSQKDQKTAPKKSQK